jgi:hypothetical protein
MHATNGAALAGAVRPAEVRSEAPAFASSSTDAHLLHLGAEFDRLHAAWLPTHAEAGRLNGLFEQEWAKKGLSIADNVAAWDQLRIDMGLDAAIEVEDAEWNFVCVVTKKIRETPAKTFAGLAVKARALRFDAHLSTQCDLPPKDQDWPEQVMNEFVAEIDRLAAAAA